VLGLGILMVLTCFSVSELFEWDYVVCLAEKTGIEENKVFLYVFRNSGVLTPHVLSEWMVEVCAGYLVVFYILGLSW
jgi:hypothetical protein